MHTSQLPINIIQQEITEHFYIVNTVLGWNTENILAYKEIRVSFDKWQTPPNAADKLKCVNGLLNSMMWEERAGWVCSWLWEKGEGSSISSETCDHLCADIKC